jgi:hypothetical protein
VASICPSQQGILRPGSDRGKLLIIHCIKNSDSYLLAMMLFQKIFVLLGSVFVGAGFIYPLSVFGMLAQRGYVRFIPQGAPG